MDEMSMNKLYEMVCKEIEAIAQKGELSAGDLDTVHKLTDTLKNIDKIWMLEEDEGGYSQEAGRGGNWNAKGSYARGSSYGMRRGGRGGYSRGYSRGYPEDMMDGRPMMR